jgi:hypothetical protein
MDPRAQAEFLHWRNDCIAHHSRQQSNPRRSHARSMGVQRRNEAPRNGASRRGNLVPMNSIGSLGRRSHRPPTPEFEPNRPRNAFHTLQTSATPFHIQQPLQPVPPLPMPQSIDPEWLREVSQVFGPEGVAQIRQDQLRVTQAQNNPNKRVYPPPQIIHAPPPPPLPQVPIPVPMDIGQIAEFTHNAMMRARRRSTPTPRQMNI